MISKAIFLVIVVILSFMTASSQGGVTESLRPCVCKAGSEEGNWGKTNPIEVDYDKFQKAIDG